MREKLRFKGSLLTLLQKETILPNGYRVTLEVIQHPGAVLIVPFARDDTIIMLRQYRPVIKRYLYELPAGTLHPGEKPSVCARRELIEEIGYRAGELTKIGSIYLAPGYSTERIIIYSGRKLHQAEQDRQPDEIIELIQIKKPAVRKLSAAGKLTDAKTICALSLCGWL